MNERNTVAQGHRVVPFHRKIAAAARAESKRVRHAISAPIYVTGSIAQLQPRPQSRLDEANETTAGIRQLFEKEENKLNSL